MNTLSIFSFENADIRTVIDDSGKPMFVASDIAKALGYKDTSRAVREHCNNGGVKYTPILDSMGRSQDARVIYEPDLYRLIMKSKLPSAQRFESWVFEDVLPKLRETGVYSLSTENRTETAYNIAAKMHKAMGITGSTQLQLNRKFAEKHCPEALAALPYYGVDTQSDIPQGSTEEFASATLLLKEQDLTSFFKSARSYNISAIKAGLIEERNRLTTGGKTQPVKWLTDKGLKYGVNRMDERNQNQIHWFSKTFSEAVDIVFKFK